MPNAHQTSSPPGLPDPLPVAWHVTAALALDGVADELQRTIARLTVSDLESARWHGPNAERAGAEFSEVRSRCGVLVSALRREAGHHRVLAAAPQTGGRS